VTRVELESGLLPMPAGSAALSVSWRARSRQIRDHHRAQRRGFEPTIQATANIAARRRFMVAFLTVLCAPPRSGCSHSAGVGFIRNCLHPCTVAAIQDPLRSPLPRSVSRGRSILHEQTIIGFAPIYNGHAQTCRSGRVADLDRNLASYVRPAPLDRSGFISPQMPERMSGCKLHSDV
jgi:hypothetical protein